MFSDNIMSNYSNLLNENKTTIDNTYLDLNTYPNMSKLALNYSNNDIDKLINDPLTNRKDLTMLLRKRMFNNSNVLLCNDITTYDTEHMNTINDSKSIQTDLANNDYKIDLSNDKSIDLKTSKIPLVIRDYIPINKDLELILVLNKKELDILQINKCNKICWESLLLEIYNIPFEFSDEKLESIFRSCKFKIISLQREQHLFNRPSDATICISYKTNDLKVLDIGHILASNGILLHVKQIITY